MGATGASPLSADDAVARWLAAAQPRAQLRLALADRGQRHVLTAGMRERGITGAEVDRWNPQRIEPGDIGPAKLGARGSADGAYEGRGGRTTQAGPGSPGEVGDRHVPFAEHLPDVLDRLVGRSIGGEAIVDRHDALVGYDVARHPAADAHRVQALMKGKPVDVWLARLVTAEQVEDPASLVHRVAAHP